MSKDENKIETERKQYEFEKARRVGDIEVKRVMRVGDIDALTFCTKLFPKRYIRSNAGLAQIRKINSSVMWENPLLEDVCASTLLVMLIGQSGTGKSTFVRRVALNFSDQQLPWYRSFPPFVPAPTMQNRPVVFISIRQIQQKIENNKDKTSGQHPIVNLSRQIFGAIGYPLQNPVVTRIMQTIKFRLNLNSVYTAQADVNKLVIKLDEVISDTFDIMAEIKKERLRGGASEEAAKGIILFDEVQDLVRNDRLRNDGGRELFDQIANLVVKNVVNEENMHFVVAGSSGYLELDFSRTPAKGPRWNRMVVGDLEEGVVLPLLQEKGLSAANIARVFEVLGSRLRMLQPILSLINVDTKSVNECISRTISVSKTAVSEFLKTSTSKEDVNRLSFS